MSAQPSSMICFSYDSHHNEKESLAQITLISCTNICITKQFKFTPIVRNSTTKLLTWTADEQEILQRQNSVFRINTM